MRVIGQALALVVAVLLLVSCARDPEHAAPTKAPDAGAQTAPSGRSQVTIHGDDRIAGSLTWQPPPISLGQGELSTARKRADAAVRAGHLYQDADAAIPLYLAILRQSPEDADARQGMQRAQVALLREGDAALNSTDRDPADATDADADVVNQTTDDVATSNRDADERRIAALRRAHAIASVARSIAPQDTDVQAYLARVDGADRLWQLERQAERDLAAGRLGESGGGALAKLREALHLRPGHGRALRGLEAIERALTLRAENDGGRGDFDAAQRWLGLAAKIRPHDGADGDAVAQARERVEEMRRARISQLRDEGLAALQQKRSDIDLARRKLEALLRIAEPGDPAGAELRDRIELATHYGLFRPGQAFTDALKNGARAPEMVVVPHGAFRMGADADTPGTSDNERPAHYLRFERGFALSQTEVTVDEFRRFVQASGYVPTATRRGHSLMYEERSGNFVRRSGIDWRSAYDGSRAGPDLPVVHVSTHDAEAYVEWLSQHSGEHYRLPSEAEFEYALRAGGNGRFPWGDGAPPAGVDNLTGSRDHSPSGRLWRNAFAGYGDGYWGPAPAGHFSANPYGLHDLGGNVSEWVADCWHDGYRRAPLDGRAWVNPGCRTRVLRGGAWASAPEQVRSSWRTPVEAETTNARIGFRVARDL